jgi:hypothetical protein
MTFLDRERQEMGERLRQRGTSAERAEITISEPDAQLVASVLEDSIQEIAEGDRREPAPNGRRRLESIVAKLRNERTDDQ